MKETRNLKYNIFYLSMLSTFLPARIIVIYYSSKHMQLRDFSLHKSNEPNNIHIVYYMCSFSLTQAKFLFLGFFLLGTPTAARSTNGPDHVWMCAFGYEKFVELNGTSGRSKGGLMCCEEPKG